MNTRTMNTVAATLLCVASIGAGAEALHDPTQPPAAHVAAPAAAVAPLRVEAIFRHGAHPSAIIDGRLVRRGDRVGAAIIQDIDGDSVRYSRGGRSEVVRLKPSKLNVRRPRAPAEEQT